MDAYMYQAALLCGPCGEKVKKELTRAGKAPDDPNDENTYDSDDFPKGPYSDGGGEADSPQHCDSCNKFLENPLTGDGQRYVEDAVKEDLRAGRRNSVAVKEWAPFYDIDTAGKDESICEEDKGHIAGTEDWSPKDQKDAYDAYVGGGKYADMSREERSAAIETLRKKNESIREDAEPLCGHPDCLRWAKEGALCPARSVGRPTDPPHGASPCLEKNTFICGACSRGGRVDRSLGGVPEAVSRIVGYLVEGGPGSGIKGHKEISGTSTVDANLQKYATPDQKKRAAVDRWIKLKKKVAGENESVKRIINSLLE